MAHYALINEKNIVVQIITGVDENIVQQDLDGSYVGGTSEAWEEFYASRPWFQGLRCKRTSYNRNIRKNYAAIGFTYDESRDAFIPPKPFDSWILNEEKCIWEAPKSRPEGFYTWDESLLDWVEVDYFS